MKTPDFIILNLQNRSREIAAKCKKKKKKKLKNQKLLGFTEKRKLQFLFWSLHIFYAVFENKWGHQVNILKNSTSLNVEFKKL